MSNLNLSKFLKELHIKKQHLKKIQNQVYLLDQLKKVNYKKVGLKSSSKLTKSLNTNFVMYIIEISFSKKNTLLHISDSAGNVQFFYSAGSFQQKGKAKAVRFIVLKRFYRLLVSKLRFLKNVPVAIHLKNIDSNAFWFLKKLKKRLFVMLVKQFNQFPYNGCRKKKFRRKKFKTRALGIRRNG